MSISPSHPESAAAARSSRTLAIETNHILPIPDEERHGTSRGLFFIWLGINMLPLTVVTGAVGTLVLGLPLVWALVAIVLGNVIGGFGAALHASQGPHLGIPQMLQARAQFGYAGGSLLSGIALVMFLGFFASNLIVASQSFAAVVPIDTTVGIIVCALVALTAAVFGYNLIRRTMAIFSMVIGALLVLALVLLAPQLPQIVAAQTAEVTPAGFFGMLAIGAVWQLAYAPYVSDYSRYLPSRTGSRPAFLAAYGGLVIGTVLVMTVGAIVGAATTGDNTMGQLGTMLGAVGPVVLLAFAVSSAIMNASNIYSGVMCTMSMLESFSARIPLTTALRIGATVVYAALAAALAIWGQGDFMAVFSDFVMILLYVLIPWSAINLADYFIVRKGDYAVHELFERSGGRYGRWNLFGLACYAIGLVVQVPFMVTNMYTGPLAEPLGFVDIAWMVGFVVSAAVYVLGARRAAAGRPEASVATTTVREEPVR